MVSAQKTKGANAAVLSVPCDKLLVATRTRTSGTSGPNMHHTLQLFRDFLAGSMGWQLVFLAVLGLSLAQCPNSTAAPSCYVSGLGTKLPFFFCVCVWS